MHDSNTPLRVNMIHQRHLNHASVSGYDRISEFIENNIFVRIKRLSLFQRLITRLLRPLADRSGSSWYGREGLFTELRMIPRWMMERDQIFHYLYAENDYRYLGWLKRWKRNRIVCTYHTPPKRFGEVVTDREHLKYIDAAIVVSRVSYDLFAKILGEDRVHFVPHGVDIEYFKPSPDKQAHGQFKCLFVGSHLRDFQLLANVARSFEQDHPEISFEVITLRRDFHFFDNLSNVTLRSGISDDELRDAYQSANLFLMPLTDATANNSVLEAMACGLPMVITDLLGVHDYVDPSCATLVRKGDEEQFKQTILELQGNSERLKDMGLNSRRLAERFSFEEVAAMTEDVYRIALQSSDASVEAVGH